MKRRVIDLVTLYRPIVDYAVQRYSTTLPSTVQRDDLNSFAFQGLLDALEKFELERDLKFETYAGWRIKGAIIDGLSQNDWVPRSVRDKARKIEEAYAFLEQQNQTSCEDQEVAQLSWNNSGRSSASYPVILHSQSWYQLMSRFMRMNSRKLSDIVSLRMCKLNYPKRSSIIILSKNF